MNLIDSRYGKYVRPLAPVLGRFAHPAPSEEAWVRYHPRAPWGPDSRLYPRLVISARISTPRARSCGSR
jgi:hypothetical protein